ncbi:MAG: hypothetical protein LBN27_12145 [Prevotellaceae bacterium]|jgi:hypothetical protein|nr:hypothetical protein [Prevotellaceae bacterium]
MENTDLTKILTVGDKVFSIILGREAKISAIDFTNELPITIGNAETGRRYSRYGSIFPDGSDCLLSPSKEKEKWENYCTFKKGDIVFVYEDDTDAEKQISVFSHKENNRFFIFDRYVKNGESEDITFKDFACCEYPQVNDLKRAENIVFQSFRRK